MGKKLPAFQFYIGDWMKDPNLRRCTRAARGMWIDIICLMFECESRGVLSTGGVPWSNEDIASATGGDTAEGLTCIDELLRKGVAHRNETGAIFCRRIVRDEQERTNAAIRKRRERQKEACHASVTPESRESHTGTSSSSSPSGCTPAESEVFIPNLQEVTNYGTGAPGIPPDYCRHFHERMTENRSWTNGFGRLIDWKKKLVRWWNGDRHKWGTGSKGEPKIERGLGGAPIKIV